MRRATRRRLSAAPAILLLVALAASPLGSDAPVYPGASWETWASPEQAGWSSAGLARARSYTAGIDTAAVLIVHGGRVLAEWGETSRKFNVHSIRKSFLCALYGIHVAAGRIDLAKTMADLGIDDHEPSLTETERTATIEDLLKARSGIYHAALYETDSMKKARPARWSRQPGTFWYYNNWDFNALGTIFERLTNTRIFEEFKRRVADPIGMQDYQVADGQYVTGPESMHPAYPFRMTARDMARFGLLYLREGRWRDRPIIGSDWIRRSLGAYSDAGPSGGYGYMWWTAAGGRHLPGVELPGGSYSARGAGGHYILVIPAADLVIVHRVNTDLPGRHVTSAEFGQLVKILLAARRPP